MEFNKPQRKKMYKEAIKKWGIPLQLGMLMEESAELIQATHKVMRTDLNSDWRNMAEEIADVEIMIEQIKLGIDWQNISERVENFKHDKLLRLKKILEVKNGKGNKI